MWRVVITMQYGKNRHSVFIFTFSSHTDVKRESIEHEWKKKNSLLLTNVYDFYVLEDETSQKKMQILWGLALYFLITCIGTE